MKKKMRKQVSDRTFGLRNGRNHKREQSKELKYVSGLSHLVLLRSDSTKKNQDCDDVAEVDSISAGNFITYERKKKTIHTDKKVLTYQRRGRSSRDKQTCLLIQVIKSSLPGNLGGNPLEEDSANNLAEKSATKESKKRREMESIQDISERQGDPENFGIPETTVTDSRATDLLLPLSHNGVILTYQRKSKSSKNTQLLTHAAESRSAGVVEDDSLEKSMLNDLGRKPSSEECKKGSKLSSSNENDSVVDSNKDFSLLNISREQYELENLNMLKTLVVDSEEEKVILPSALTGIITNEVGLKFISDSVKQSLQPLPERASKGHAKKKLLILDINGVLADIVAEVSYGRKPDAIVSRKAVFKRPFCEDFLLFCFDRFDVGIWSSRTRKNVDRVLDFLMGNLREKLLFCWDQSHCTRTEFNTIENREKPIVLKELTTLWETLDRDLSLEKGRYNESNTLLLDDSPYKALRNPMHTAVFPHSYNYQDAKDCSLGLGGDIRVFLEGLEKADDVQKYVQLNPFGQQAISESDPFWDFYSKIIESSS